MKKINQAFEFTLVLFIILMSKTAYFGIVNRRITMYILMVLCLIALIFKGRNIKKRTLITLFTLVFTLNVVTLVHLAEITSSYITEMSGMVVLFFEIAIIVTCIDKRSFSKYYVNIMTSISIISLLCFYFALKFPSAAYLMAEKVQSGPIILTISPFYTWGWGSSIFTRNSGPFWEPGAFQGFIVVALLLVIFYKDTISFYKIKFLLLVLTLIATQSTTGYILFGLLCVLLWGEILQVLLTIKRKVITYPVKFLGLIMIISCICLVASSGVILNKLTTKNVSSATRGNDIFSSSQMILEKPLFGYGCGIERTIRENSAGIINNSNGLVYMMYTYGLIFSSLYIYSYKRGLDTMFPFKGWAKRLGLYTIFITLFMAEGFYYLPIFCLFLFQWPEKYVHPALRYNKES